MYNVQIGRVSARRENQIKRRAITIKKNFISIRKCDINSIDYYAYFVKDFSLSVFHRVTFGNFVHTSSTLDGLGLMTHTNTHAHLFAFNAVFVIGLFDSSALKMKVLQSMVYISISRTEYMLFT